MGTGKPKDGKRIQIALICSVLLAGVASIGFVIPKMIDRDSNLSPHANDPFLEFTPAVSDSTHVLMETLGSAASLVLQRTEKSSATQTTLPPKAPYVIRATIEPKPHSYQDFTVSVDRTLSKITFLADGFSPDGVITLTINGKPTFEQIPFDWSGRMELQASLPNKLPAKACVRIKTEGDTLDVCHLVKEGQAA